MHHVIEKWANLSRRGIEFETDLHTIVHTIHAGKSVPGSFDIEID